LNNIKTFVPYIICSLIYQFKAWHDKYAVRWNPVKEFYTKPMYLTCTLLKSWLCTECFGCDNCNICSDPEIVAVLKYSFIYKTETMYTVYC